MIEINNIKERLAEAYNSGVRNHIHEKPNLLNIGKMQSESTANLVEEVEKILQEIITQTNEEFENIWESIRIIKEQGY